MGQLLIRNLDDSLIDTLKRRAKLASSSLEAEARAALTKGLQLTGDEKVALIRQWHEEARALMVPGAEQIEGWKLIREDRDTR
jgi:plasmid stability protein